MIYRYQFSLLLHPPHSPYTTHPSIPSFHQSRIKYFSSMQPSSSVIHDQISFFPFLSLSLSLFLPFLPYLPFLLYLPSLPSFSNYFNRI
ncbi:hypothetical protein SS1G_14399 [Sclerotinia sclerotiorum 1980 UF-70]|uniref:Uncharacterized protein n=1 Tax=Sclerotinia sclerotiorum (strain ATCC 18683 / 1980 / Ss-1) TaxID=665079 RepID=A7F9W8_SCLS1|nr:hypothetical protein SS1G_14399 [Sclerotinia sclerotiorum 1980 UF-70]EDO00529.1 hypothetical protein SS1G_14399 [Sclerotinia sclerotiorum 1980 UF-70]